MSEMICCVCCGRLVPANPRAKNQEYCGRHECQKARKAKWQREKKEKDEKYRLEQKAAAKLWRDNNPDYWRKYREKHPEYTERNRLLQKKRDSKSKTSHLAKMDASGTQAPVIAGTYYLVRDLAKMDASHQKIHIITAS